MSGTINCWPFDAVSSAPDYTGEMLRQTTGGIIGGKTSTRTLGARSGIWPGTPDSVVSVSGTTVTVGIHSGVIDGEASTTAGPYVYAVAVAPTQALNAADATNPRIDLISLQLSDPAESDGSSVPGVALVYTVGTAASSPTVPSSPARSLVLSHVNVPHSGGGSATITMVAPYAVAAGGILLTRSSSDYPASPHEGMHIYDLALNETLFYNGSSWQNIIPTAPTPPIAYTYSGTPYAGTTPGSGQVQKLIQRSSGTTDSNGLITLTYSATSVLDANAIYDSASSSTGYYFVPRRDLVTTSTFTWQMWTQAGSVAASTAYTATKWVEYQ